MKLSGEWGDVEIDFDNARVTKRSRNVMDDEAWSNRRRLLCLSRELLFLQHLGHGGHTPKVMSYTSEKGRVCGHPMNLVTEITMEYAGPTLIDCYTEGFLIHPKKLLKDVMEACAFLEEKEVIHFDIKANNITFCMDSGRAKLIDFGISEFTCRDVTSSLKIQPLLQREEDSIQIMEDFGILHGNGMLFFQNDFFRASEGKTNVYIEVSHPVFRDPTLLCADYLGISAGHKLDSRADVYGAAFSIMYYTGWMLQFKWEDCSNSVLRLLAANRNLRGSITYSEMIFFREVLLCAAQRCKGHCDDGLLLAMQSKLSHPHNYKGILGQTISRLYGPRFSECMKTALQPVSAFRMNAKECLEILSKEEEPSETWQGETNLSIFSNSVGDLVGQIRAKRDCIVSVIIRDNMLLWSSCIVMVPTGVKVSLVEKLHERICGCGELRHAVTWYSCLDRSHRMEVNCWVELL